MRRIRWLVVLLLTAPIALAPGGGATGGSATVNVLAPGDLYVTGAWVDGMTMATLDTSGHVHHAFTCAVTNSASGPLGNGSPYPANMVGADSIAVGFDVNGDTVADTTYAGRSSSLRRFAGTFVERAQDPYFLVNGLLETVAAIRDGYWPGPTFPPVPGGPTPFAAGNVDGGTMFVWNEGSADVTVDCGF